MIIKTIKGISPKFGKNCFFAESATLIGEVIMGDEVSVWYHSVVRGDVNSIRIGNKVNEKNQSGTMICSDETEDSLVSLFKMISENDMRTFMDEQGKSLLSCMF